MELRETKVEELGVDFDAGDYLNFLENVQTNWEKSLHKAISKVEILETFLGKKIGSIQQVNTTTTNNDNCAEKSPNTTGAVTTSKNNGNGVSDKENINGMSKDNYACAETTTTAEFHSLRNYKAYVAKYKKELQKCRSENDYLLLLEEIEMKRAQDEKPWDINSVEWKQHVMEELGKQKMCVTEAQKQKLLSLCGENAAAFHDVGAPFPMVSGVEVELKLKPGASTRVSQPYRLGKFEATQLNYLLEEEIRQGKMRKWDHEIDGTPIIACPVFVGERKKTPDGPDFNRLPSFQSGLRRRCVSCAGHARNLSQNGRGKLRYFPSK